MFASSTRTFFSRLLTRGHRRQRRRRRQMAEAEAQSHMLRWNAGLPAQCRHFRAGLTNAAGAERHSGAPRSDSTPMCRGDALIKPIFRSMPSRGQPLVHVAHQQSVTAAASDRIGPEPFRQVKAK